MLRSPFWCKNLQYFLPWLAFSVLHTLWTVLFSAWKLWIQCAFLIWWQSFSFIFFFFFFKSFWSGSVVSIMYVVTMQKGWTCIKLKVLLVILNWHIFSWYAMGFLLLFLAFFIFWFCFASSFVCLTHFTSFEAVNTHSSSLELSRILLGLFVLFYSVFFFIMVYIWHNHIWHYYYSEETTVKYNQYKHQ